MIYPGGGLTFRRIMSISEYFIPFTRIGISLKKETDNHITTQMKHIVNNLTLSNDLLACEDLLDQVARQGLFTDGLFSQSQPELTGLQSHILIWVLGPLQHVLVTDNNR